MNLAEVVNHTEQQPLCVDFPFAAQREVIQSFVETDIGKHRLGCSDPLAVDQTTCQRIDLPLHFLTEGLRSGCRASQKEVDLTGLGLIWMLQTLAPQLANAAIGLSTPKLDGPVTPDDHIASIPIQPLSRRADAETLVCTEGEILREEQGRLC
jgi:hypothetical protein